MTPETLFDVAKRTLAARSGDPQTSHKAVIAARVNIGKTALFLYQLFNGEAGPMAHDWTDDEIEHWCGECGITHTPQSLRSARLVLYRLGFIKIAGVRKTRRGNEAQLWVSTGKRLDPDGNTNLGDTDATDR